MKLRYLFLLVVVLFITPAAFGQLLGDDPLSAVGISDGCAGTMSPDVCFHSGDWWNVTYYGNGAQIDCGLSGGCATCGQNRYGKFYCVYGIAASASCTCTNVPRAGAGPGITDCQPQGICTYRSNP